MWLMVMSAILFFASIWNSFAFEEYPTENRLLGLFEGDIMFRNGSDLLEMNPLSAKNTPVVIKNFVQSSVIEDLKQKRRLDAINLTKKAKSAFETGPADRNAMPDRGRRWPGGVVVYELDSTYSESDIEVIRSAIAEFEEHTCIQWVERTDEEVYVEIENDIGCWAEPGRIGSVQTLSLESPACMKKGVVMHEMMHTLGFLHEQSRSDRDDYVRVVWNNIIVGMEQNFQKLPPIEIDDLGLPYDYGSIMHYTAYMFADDRSTPTLTPLDRAVPLNQLGYGQAHAVFSDLDLQKIKEFYECP